MFTLLNSHRNAFSLTSRRFKSSTSTRASFSRTQGIYRYSNFNYYGKKILRPNAKAQKQRWHITSFALMALGSLATFLFYTKKAQAEENVEVNEPKTSYEVKIHEVTRENFQEIIDLLAQNSPAIQSIKFTFTLTGEKLEALYNAIQNNTEIGYITWHENQFRASKTLKLIETKLIANNKSYKYYPSDYEFGLLSMHVNQHSEPGDVVSLNSDFAFDKETLKNWRVERVFDNTSKGITDTKKSGYYSVIYVNDSTHQVVLSIRGIEGGIMNLIAGLATDLHKSNSAWKTMLDEIVGGQIVVGQQALNYFATEEALRIAKEKGYRVSFTGHSLGGWLAELSVYYCHAFLDNPNVKAVTFQSPGSLPMMENLQSNVKNKKNVNPEDLDIVTYLSRPNPINSCNKHVGTIYTVITTARSSEWAAELANKVPGLLKGPVAKSQFLLSLEGYDMSAILMTFDPLTGKPEKCKEILNWPVMEYTGEKKNFNQTAQNFLAEKVKGQVDNMFFPKKAETDSTDKTNQQEKHFPQKDETDSTDRTNQHDKHFPKKDETDSTDRTNQHDKHFPKKDETDSTDKVNQDKQIKNDPKTLYLDFAQKNEDRLIQAALDCIVGDTTIMTIVGFLINFNQIDKRQFWSYYKYINLEEENEEGRKILDFDRRFALLTLAKYQAGDGTYPMQLTTGSVDMFLYNLYYEKDLWQKQNDSFEIVQNQLDDLLSTFEIHEKADGKFWLKPTGKNDVENIRQRAKRLKQVIPNTILTFLRINPKLIDKADEESTTNQTHQFTLPDNLDWKVTNYIKAGDKEKELDEQIRKNQVVVISGTGGMGKSTLAQKFGKNCKDEEWIVRWQPATNIDEAFLNLAKDLKINTFNISPEDIRNGVYGRLDALNPKKQILLIFDNVIDGEKMEWYLKNLPTRAKIIITTRNERLLRGTKSLELNGFTKEEGILYLKQALRESEENARKLVDVVSTSPFRLSTVVDYFNKNLSISVDEYIRKYKEKDQSMYRGVEMLFDTLQYREKSLSLLQYLAYLHPDGVPLQLIENVMGQNQTELNVFIQDLFDSSLIDFDRNTKIIKIKHSFIQEETKNALHIKDQTQILKILKNLLDELVEVFPIIGPDPDNWPEASKWAIQGEMLVEETKKMDVFFPATRSLLLRLGFYHYFAKINESDAIEFWEIYLDYHNKYTSKDQRDNLSVALILSFIGRAYQKLGGTENLQIGLEYQIKGLNMHRNLFPENNANVAASLNETGKAYLAVGNISLGLEHQLDALKMYRTIFPENHPDVANMLNHIGNTYRSLGGDDNVNLSIKYQMEALEMFTALFGERHPKLVETLHAIGFGYQHFKTYQELETALDCHLNALALNKALFPGNNLPVAESLTLAGIVYLSLPGEDNIQQALGYFLQALQMRQTLYPGKHFFVAESQKYVGLAYIKLPGVDNIQKGIKYLEDGLEMFQEFLPENHLDLADSLAVTGLAYKILRNEEHTRIGLKRLKDALKITKTLFPGNHADTAMLLNEIGLMHVDLGGEDILQGLNYLKEGLNMRKELFGDYNTHVSSSLANIGKVYGNLEGEKNIREGLKFLEDALKTEQKLFLTNLKNYVSEAAVEQHYFQVAFLLKELGDIYLKSGDNNKALEYLKHSYAFYNLPIEQLDEGKKEIIKHLIEHLDEQKQAIKTNVESHHPNFFKPKNQPEMAEMSDCLGGNRVGSECRWTISSRGEITDDLLMIKQKIQKNVLNNIANAVVENYGWTYVHIPQLWSSDYGVKGYIEANYLTSQLGELANSNENLEMALKLSFEAMNLGIMKSPQKPYEVVQAFTRAHPELVKKIAKENPEYFVDGSIVEACVKEMLHDESFGQHIFEHVQYFGMNVRREEVNQTT